MHVLLFLLQSGFLVLVVLCKCDHQLVLVVTAYGRGPDMSVWVWVCVCVCVCMCVCVCVCARVRVRASMPPPPCPLVSLAFISPLSLSPQSLPTMVTLLVHLASLFLSCMCCLSIPRTYPHAVVLGS